jgi:exosortase
LSSKPLISSADSSVRSWAARRWLIWSAALSAALLLLYAPVLKNLAIQWWTDPDYSHGILVLFFSAYVLWRQRERWTKTAIKPDNFGLLIILGAIALLFVGSIGAELFSSRISLLILLAGIVVFLGGWNFLRAIYFPLAFLAFMIPLPAIVYNQITFPLQLIASRIATFCLDFVNIPVLREGNILILSNYSLEVVEACSGIRSLMGLISLAVIYTHFIEPRRWLRYLLVLLMLPIAILSNALRIMGTGALAHQFGPVAAEGFLHAFSGWVIFVAALLLFVAIHWILRRLVALARRLARA